MVVKDEDGGSESGTNGVMVVPQEEETTKDDDDHHHIDETGEDAPIDTAPISKKVSNTRDGVTGTGTENGTSSTASESESETATNISTEPNLGGTNGDNRTLRQEIHTGGSSTTEALAGFHTEMEPPVVMI